MEVVYFKIFLFAVSHLVRTQCKTREMSQCMEVKDNDLLLVLFLQGHTLFGSIYDS